MMNQDLKKIIDLSLVWKEDPRNSRFFIVIIDSNTYHLRLNDFPEEILYTLFKNEKYLMDLETAPNNWIIPFDSKQESRLRF